MNSRLKYILAALLMLAFAATLWLLRSRETPRLAGSDKTSALPTTQNSTAPLQQSAAAPASSPLNLDRAAKIDRAVRTANVPIQFWGKVIDPEGKPIEGVKVELGVKQVYSPLFGTVAQTEKKRIAETDGGGMFSISGDSGLALSIRSVTKSGYRLSARAETSFAYAASPYLYSPRQDAPVTFVMMPLGRQEPLYHYYRNEYVLCDGTAVMHTLLVGKDAPAGQLSITFRREPVHIRTGQRFSWSATLEVQGGDIMEMPHGAAYIAPENGWVKKVVVEKAADDPKWLSGFIRSYYIRTSGTKYGRIQVDLNGRFEPPPTACALEVFMNPSGSRNLEPSDSLKAPWR